MRPAERRRLRPEERRLIARVTSLWGLLTLSGMMVVVGLTIWHLVRRGRLIRESLPPPKLVEPLEIPTVEQP